MLPAFFLLDEHPSTHCSLFVLDGFCSDMIHTEMHVDGY